MESIVYRKMEQLYPYHYSLWHNTQVKSFGLYSIYCIVNMERTNTTRNLTHCKYLDVQFYIGTFLPLTCLLAQWLHLNFYWPYKCFKSCVFEYISCIYMSICLYIYIFIWIPRYHELSDVIIYHMDTFLNIIHEWTCFKCGSRNYYVTSL